MISFDKLEEIAKQDLEFAKHTVERDGAFAPMISVIYGSDENIQMEVFCLAGEIANSQELKYAITKRIANRARERNASAVITSCDAYAIELTDEAKERMSRDPDFKAAFDNAKDLAEAEALGFGKRMEIIGVVLETPLRTVTFSQRYDRDQNDKAVFVEEIRRIDSLDGIATKGNMINFSEEGIKA